MAERRSLSPQPLPRAQLSRRSQAVHSRIVEPPFLCCPRCRSDPAPCPPTPLPPPPLPAFFLRGTDGRANTPTLDGRQPSALSAELFCSVPPPVLVHWGAWPVPDKNRGAPRRRRLANAPRRAAADIWQFSHPYVKQTRTCFSSKERLGPISSSRPVPWSR